MFCLHETSSMGVGCLAMFQIECFIYVCEVEVHEIIGLNEGLCLFQLKFITNLVHYFVIITIFYKKIKLYMLSLKLHNIKLSLNSPWLWTLLFTLTTHPRAPNLLSAKRENFIRTRCQILTKFSFIAHDFFKNCIWF